MARLLPNFTFIRTESGHLLGRKCGVTTMHDVLRPTKTVAIAQVPISSDITNNLGTILSQIEAAAAIPADLLVLPEYALSGRCQVLLDHRPGDLDSAIRDGLERLVQASRRYGLAVVIPTLFRDNHWYSSVLVIEPGQGIIHRHDKSVLTPYELEALSTGRSVTVVQLGGISDGILLCSEGNGPELLSALALSGAQIVLHLSCPDSEPGVWPGKSTDAWEVDIEALFPLRTRIRALSCQVYMISAVPAWCGSLSRIVDPEGTQLVSAGPVATTWWSCGGGQAGGGCVAGRGGRRRGWSSSVSRRGSCAARLGGWRPVPAHSAAG